jgi:hypothetical protein
MPSDITLLEKLGLRDIPRWYREKFNVPSLLQANYGNNHRGQPQQAAVDQPAQRAIQHHPAAINASTTGTSVSVNGTTNAADNASTAGPSGHAKGINNTANNASTTGHSAHAHPNGNVTHNTGNNNNGNHPGHGHPHPRGGRYKSPRGGGFTAAGKGGGNLNWGKNGRNGVIPPPANIVKATHGDDTPSTESRPTSSGSSFSISSRPGMDLLASPLVNPMTNMTLTGQPTLDKETMARKTSMTARLRQLTPEASYASPVPKEEPEQNFFRTKTRRVFSFGADGDKIAAAKSKGAAPFDPFASLTKDETTEKTTAPALTPMIRKLVATSQPIDPNEPLINWGPIGAPVQRPAPAVNTTYAMALINGQVHTGAKGQSAYPYMGQH